MHSNLEQFHWFIRLAAIALLVVGGIETPGVAAQTASWSQPDIDVFFYVHGSNVGARRRGPTFGNLVFNSANGDFDPQTATDPARFGSTLFAFDTSATIEAGLAPSRYVIESVTMTAMVQEGSSATEALVYEPNAKTAAGHVAEYAAGGPTAAQPMELFGVGFRGDLEGFALGPNQAGERFSESTLPYDDAVGGYVAYPAVGDTMSAGYLDVSNNVTGGFSATSAGNTTSAFDAQPWAIGTTNLNPGDDIPHFTTFTFQLDLDAAGVRSYIQQSLGSGAIGFMLSSLHATAEFGGGDSPYPQWLLKEATGGAFPIAGAEAATLQIAFSIADELIAGDYDGSGYVDQADYAMWKQSFDLTGLEPGSGADGNGDTFVRMADYTVWRDNLGAGVPPASLSSVTAVPEPPSALVILLAIAATLCGWVNRHTWPADSRRI